LAASHLIEDGTNQVLQPGWAAANAVPVETRSHATTVTLDLFSPTAGGLYSRRGNPYLASGETPNTLLRTLYDVCGVLSLALPFVDRGVYPLGLFVGMGAAALGLNRLFGIYYDVQALEARNRLAASGFRFEAPTPVR
jgi:hypothetical protein